MKRRRGRSTEHKMDLTQPMALGCEHLKSYMVQAEQ